MKGPSSFLALPAAILALIALPLARAQAEQWPYNLPRTLRYWPENEVHIRRHVRAQEQLALKMPVGVRKMSNDPGEKFWLDDWKFGDTVALEAVGDRVVQGEATLRPSRAQSDFHVGTNASTPAYPPFLPHSDRGRRYFLQFWERGLFERGFTCPAGTTSCVSIGQPNSCCQSGETCISVTDTGNGPVGCCPASASCGDTISSCDANQGYTSCPNSTNGGCCIPGYACLDVGCVLTATETVYATLPVQTVTTGVIYSTTAYSDSTVTYAVPSSGSAAPSVSVSGDTITTTATATVTAMPTSSAVIVPATASYSSTTTITLSSTVPVQAPLTCTTGFFSCPASLGGGCCATGQACGTSSLCPDTTTASTVTAVAPVRPTTDAGTTLLTASPATSSTVVVSGCPTGFYMCSAYYLGGCCQVGRNCDTTSCPASESTSVISTSGVTVVAPNGAGVASVSTTIGTNAGGVVTLTSTTTALDASVAAAAAGTQGSCAGGWYSCGSNTGGGCCPSGYVCGASCTATVSGVPDQAKELPSSASIAAWTLGFVVFALAAGIGMIVL